MINIKNIVKYPLNYTGSKHKLMPVLKNLFPSKISMFYDVFGGGVNVAANVESDYVYCNDINNYVISILKGIQNNEINSILNNIQDLIDAYELSKTNRQGFEKLRKDYNSGKTDWITLFVLVCYSFNYQMRFNNSHKYNSSFGKDRSCFTPNMKNNLIKFNKRLKEIDIVFNNKDFRKIDYSDADMNDLVYFDPPYLLSYGVYQDGKRGFSGWGKADEVDLYTLCDKLNEQGTRFTMSNVIKSKGQVNELLKEWSKQYKTHYLSMDYGNSNYQRKDRSGDIEVLITNY